MIKSYPITNLKSHSSIDHNIKGHQNVLYAICTDENATNPFLDPSTEYVGYSVAGAFGRLSSHYSDYTKGNGSLKSTLYKSNPGHRYFMVVLCDENLTVQEMEDLENKIFIEFNRMYGHLPPCNNRTNLNRTSVNSSIVDKHFISIVGGKFSNMNLSTPNLNLNSNSPYSYNYPGLTLKPNDPNALNFSSGGSISPPQGTPVDKYPQWIEDKFDYWIRPEMNFNKNGDCRINPSKVAKVIHNFTDPKFLLNRHTPNIQGNPPWSGFWVDPEHIHIDNRIQRDPSPEFVLFLIANFDWSGFGTIDLVKDPNGRLMATDGQHRILALIGIYRLYGIKLLAPVSIQETSDASTYLNVASRAFLANNASRTLTIAELHDPMVLMGNKRAKSIENNIFKANNWNLRSQKPGKGKAKPGDVYRLESLHFIYDECGEDTMKWVSDQYTKWFYGGKSANTSIDTDIIKNIGVLTEIDLYFDLDQHVLTGTASKDLDTILSRLMKNGYTTLMNESNGNYWTFSTPNKMQKGLAYVAGELYDGTMTKYGVAQLLLDIMALYFDRAYPGKNITQKISQPNNRNLQFNSLHNINLLTVPQYIKGIWNNTSLSSISITNTFDEDGIIGVEPINNSDIMQGLRDSLR